MSDYPKLMTRGAEEITVGGTAEQGDREADGWRAVDVSVVLASVTPVAPEEAPVPPTFGAPDDGTGEGPTEGPSHDDTHVKRGSHKKK